MDNKAKVCFCCNKIVSKDAQKCPKCGALLPLEIDPTTYEKSRKALQWSIIVGGIVGFFATCIFIGIDPNSHLFLFLHSKTSLSVPHRFP